CQDAQAICLDAQVIFPWGASHFDEDSATRATPVLTGFPTVPPASPLWQVSRPCHRLFLVSILSALVQSTPPMRLAILTDKRPEREGFCPSMTAPVRLCPHGAPKQAAILADQERFC